MSNERKVEPRVCTMNWGEDGPIYITTEEYRKTITISDIHSGNLYFCWGGANGFGELSFSIENGKATFDSEGLGLETTRQLLYAVVDKLVDEGTFK